MSYRDYRDEKNEYYTERLELVMERIAEIAEGETCGAEDFSGSTAASGAEDFPDASGLAVCDIIRSVARHLCFMYELAQRGASDGFAGIAEEEGRFIQERLFGQMVPENYDTSFLNPAHVKKLQSSDIGLIFGTLYSKICSFYPEIFEGDYEKLCLYAELFVQLYCELQEPECCKDDISSFMRDNVELFHEDEVRRMVDPDYDYAASILTEADFGNPAYLYRYGLPVGDDARRRASYLNSLSDSEVCEMADELVGKILTMSAGDDAGKSSDRTKRYLASAGAKANIAFDGTKANMSSAGKNVELEYPIGCERIVRRAVGELEMMGVRLILRPYAAPVNCRYDYDIAQCDVLWLDKAYVERSLETESCAFENVRALAAQYAGKVIIRQSEAGLAPEDTLPSERQELPEQCRASAEISSAEAGLAQEELRRPDETRQPVEDSERLTYTDRQKRLKEHEMSDLRVISDRYIAREVMDCKIL